MDERVTSKVSCDRRRLLARLASAPGSPSGVLAAGVVAVLVLGPVSTAGATRAPLGLSRAVKVIAPSNAYHNPSGWLRGVSCTSPGDCTSAGRYEDSSGQQETMVATETGGEWAQGSEVLAPANGNKNPDGVLTSVSCASADNCTAVGSYNISSGQAQAMAATETKGKWGRATELSLPAGARAGQPYANLDAASCTSPGDCTAVGHYTNSSGSNVAMVATESDGKWGQAAELRPPANAGTGGTSLAVLFSVSCTSKGDCTAVGIYSDTSHHRDAMVATEAGGTWGQAAEFDLFPSGASGAWGYLSGVWCSSPGNCEAVGAYLDTSSNTQAMVATEAGGTWGQAAELSLPTGANSEAPNAELEAVSCASAGNCVGSGVFSTTESYSRDMVATEIGGKWDKAVELSPPPGAQGEDTILGGSGNGVACAKNGDCTAVGSYRDSSGNTQAMAAAGTV